MPDTRAPQRITWKPHDVLMSGFAMFYFQHPTLLQFQHNLEKYTGRSNLQRRDKNGDVHYYHTVVGATLVRAGSHDILPLDAEEVRNTDGQVKQDCEINAGKRLVQRLRHEHRQLPMVIAGDDLYAHEPFILEVRALRMSYVLMAKPESHKELYERVEDFDRLGQCVKGTWEEGPLANWRWATVYTAPAARTNPGVASGTLCASTFGS